MSSEPDSPAPSSEPQAPPPLIPSAPAPPSSEQLAMDLLRRRMEGLEIELARERERARGADALLKQREALRSEIEGEIRRLTDSFRQQKTVEHLEEERAQYRGRIEALEARFTAMHDALTGLLQQVLHKPQPPAPPAPPPPPPPPTPAPELALLGAAVGDLQRQLSSLEQSLVPLRGQEGLLESIRQGLSSEGRRRADEEAAARDSLRELAAEFTEEAAGRLADIDRRINQRLDESEERLRAAEREREAVRRELEGNAAALRREIAASRGDSDNALGERLRALADTVASTAREQQGVSRAASSLETAAGRLLEALERPPQVREQMIQELEREKRLLSEELRGRGEKLRAYVEERRRVEASLADSLMERTRELEAERSRAQHAVSKEGRLEALAEGLRVERDLLAREAQGLRGRLEAMGAERDAASKALMEESARAKEIVSSRSAATKVWEERLTLLEAELAEQRRARAAAQSEAEELRSRLDALTRHLASLSSVAAGPTAPGGWMAEREELMAALRKKDAMLGVLSETFRSLVEGSRPDPGNPPGLSAK